MQLDKQYCTVQWFRKYVQAKKGIHELYTVADKKRTCGGLLWSVGTYAAGNSCNHNRNIIDK